MTAFERLNYREILAFKANELKKSHPHWTLQKLAVAAQMQPPYLTNVFKERAHLNLDQVFALTRLLQLPDDESEYIALLLEWERSGNPERRNLLKEKVDSVRKARLTSKATLKKEIVTSDSAEMTQFYLNPYYKLINAFVGVARFAKDPLKIATCLNISKKQLQQWLADLTRMGFVERKAAGYEKLKRNFHLPKESPLCEPNQILMHQCASQHMHRLPDGEKFNFQLTFSADEATREKVQREFLNFLKTIEADVKAAPSENVYGLSFDLFTWSFER